MWIDADRSGTFGSTLPDPSDLDMSSEVSRRALTPLLSMERAAVSLILEHEEGCIFDRTSQRSLTRSKSQQTR